MHNAQILVDSIIKTSIVVRPNVSLNLTAMPLTLTTTLRNAIYENAPLKFRFLNGTWEEDGVASG